MSFNRMTVAYQKIGTIFPATDKKQHWQNSKNGDAIFHDCGTIPTLEFKKGVWKSRNMESGTRAGNGTRTGS